MTKITLDDPRLTTYALGELEDSNDRHLIETALTRDPELRAYVDEIQSLGETLKSEFANEQTPGLARVITAAPKQFRPWRCAWPVGLAACFAVVVAVQMKPLLEGNRVAETGDVLAVASETVAMDRQLEDQAATMEQARETNLELKKWSAVVDNASHQPRTSFRSD